MRAHEALLGALLGGAAANAAAADARLPVESRLPSLAGATAWLNSTPLTPEALRGKVVLVDFWTYTCINWLRTLPYMRAWAEKYRDQGLVVIGVHTPEFEFEKDAANVARAVREMNINYPVAIDSEHAVWNAFANQYWPALYFVDAEGRVRHHQFGEGDYDRAEEIIQQLLTEAGHGGGWQDEVEVEGRGVEAAADFNHLRSPETYTGFERAENFASPGGVIPYTRRAYRFPTRLRLNQWALAGDWTVGTQAAVASAGNGRIAFRFQARDLHLVMGTAAAVPGIRFRVSIDGKPPGAAHGIDVDDDGYGTVSERRLYQLVRQSGPIADRVFEIEFLDAGAEAYAFTFG